MGERVREQHELDATQQVQVLADGTRVLADGTVILPDGTVCVHSAPSVQ